MKHRRALLLALVLPCLSQAQDQTTIPFKEENVGNHTASGVLGKVTVEGAFSGVAITVDEAFTAKHENKPPSAPFKVIASKDLGLRVLAGGKKTGVPELLRLTLPDAGGTKAAEILRFGQLYMKQSTAAERMQEAVQVLRKGAFPMFTQGFEKARELEIYRTKVGSYEAVVMHIEMTKPVSGEEYLVKAVVIPHPSKDGGVVGFLMADKALSEVKTLEDLSSKGVGLRMLHSLKFIEE
jgi:hypothetical protein